MTHTHAALIAVVAVVLAGCAGTGPGTTTDGTTTGTSVVTTETAETTETTASTEERTMNETEAHVRDRAVSAMAAVETYAVRSVVNRTLSANGVEQTLAIEGLGVFDRQARELRLNRTTTGPSGTVAETIYVVDRRLYQHSRAYARQYASEWLTADLSDEFGSLWRAQDTMTRQRATLANASVEVVGTERVDGTRTYVVEADVNETTYAEYTARMLGTTAIEVEEVTITFWFSTETWRPLRSAGVVNSTTTSRGQTIAVTERFTLEFRDYGEPATIGLPEAAETAVSLDNATAQESADVAGPGDRQWPG